MPELTETSLIADLARDTVRQVAPQELPRFRAASQAYFEDPQRALEGEPSKDQMLGFGTGHELAFITPIVLAMATQVVQFVFDEVASSLKEESPAVIQAFVQKLFKRLRPAEEKSAQPEQAKSSQANTPAPPTLTPEQLARVRHIAFETARRWNLAEPKAALLADTLVGSLAVQPT